MFQMSKSRKKIELKRKRLLTNKEKSDKNRTPLSITYNRILPGISKIMNKNWNILQINTKFREVF